MQSTLPGSAQKRDIAPISRIKRTMSSPLEKRTFSICPALPKKNLKTFSTFTFLHPVSVTCYKVVTVYTVRYVTRTARTPATVTLPPGVVTSGVTSYETITTTVPNGELTSEPGTVGDSLIFRSLNYNHRLSQLRWHDDDLLHSFYNDDNYSKCFHFTVCADRS